MIGVLAILLGTGLVGLACSTVSPLSPYPVGAPSAPAVPPGDAAQVSPPDPAAPAAPAVDPKLQALERQNAELQATLTARQDQARIAAAQQTQTALQAALAQPTATPIPDRPAAPPVQPAATPVPSRPADPPKGAEAKAIPPPAEPPVAETTAEGSPALTAEEFIRALVEGDVERARGLMSPSARSAPVSDLARLSRALSGCSGSELSVSTTDTKGTTHTAFVTFAPVCGDYNAAFGAILPAVGHYTQRAFDDARIWGCNVSSQPVEGRWRVSSRTIGCPPAYS